MEREIRSSRLSGVGGFRGSVLFGRRHSQELWIDHIEGGSFLAVDRGNRTTGVIAGSVGLQYNRRLTRGADAFIRCGWEGQLWFDVGSPTNASNDMGMEGLCVASGITR